MLVRVKDRDGFESNVFGADCFIEHWPEILTTGIEVKQLKRYGNNWFYVMEDGKPVNDTAFFSVSEMKYLEEVK